MNARYMQSLLSQLLFDWPGLKRTYRHQCGVLVGPESGHVCEVQAPIGTFSLTRELPYDWVWLWK